MFLSRDPIHLIFKACGPLLLAAALVVHADADSEPATRPAAQVIDQGAIAKWFSDLAGTDPETREHARDHLMRLTRGDLPQLEQLLRRTPRLAPSQVIALRQIIQEIYLGGEPYDKETEGGEHGFLGITMDQVDSSPQDLQQPNDEGQAPGIVVAGRFSGFCAGRMLRDGDVILGCTGPDTVFKTTRDLINAISGAEPGATLRLKVLRHGQVIVVPVVLDSRPRGLDPRNVDSFRQQRAEKFDEYWRQTFAPLLKESVG